MHNQITSEMQECIDVCLECSTVCAQTVPHCLSMGEKHTKPDHIVLLLDCIDICQTSANFMSRLSNRHVETCGVCAEVCRECAESCRSLEGEEMEKCAQACERCADSCDKMARTGQPPEKLRAAGGRH